MEKHPRTAAVSKQRIPAKTGRRLLEGLFIPNTLLATRLKTGRRQMACRRGIRQGAERRSTRKIPRSNGRDKRIPAYYPGRPHRFPARCAVYASDIRIESVSHEYQDFQDRTPIKFGGVAVDRVTLLNVALRVAKQPRSPS